MEYKNIKQAKFIKRPNRFIAYVYIDGVEEIVHVKNTGRCKELLVPEATVILEEGIGEKRKTKYSLIAVYKGNALINMDSQVPNAVVSEALTDGKILEVGKVSFLKREVTFLSSRFDIFYEKNGVKGFIEVKGVTLENDRLAMFPDAPTARGTKHVYELIKAVEEGYEAGLLFLIQMKGVDMFNINYKMDSLFSEAVKKAYEKGVKIMVYDSVVTENSIVIGEKVKFII